jgi:hypothetical protein
VLSQWNISLWPLFPPNHYACDQGLHDVIGIDRGPPGHVVGTDEVFTVEMARTICMVLVTLAFTGPGWPFGSHCLDCGLVSSVWNEMADLSMVTILSRITIERQRTITKRFLLVLTLSFFMSYIRSFGIHLTDFFVRFWSCLRVRLVFLFETPLALVSFFKVTRLSFSMLAATSGINAGVVFFLFEFRCCSFAAGLPSLTFFKMS